MLNTFYLSLILISNFDISEHVDDFEAMKIVYRKNENNQGVRPPLFDSLFRVFCMKASLRQPHKHIDNAKF